MDSQFWLWLDTLAMLAGGGVILVAGKQRTAHEQAHTIFHGIVPIIAACSYLAMAVGQGSVILGQTAAGGGRLFYFARYLDWTFTTPLLLLALAYTALESGLRRGGLIAGLLLADVMMIVTSFFFGASDVIWIKWTWFAVSCVAFLAVYYVMWGPLLRENASERASVQADYRRNAAMLSVLWLIYPIILFFSTDGTGIFGDTLGVALIAVLDLVSKVAYGLLTISSTRNLVDEEVGVGAKAPAMQRAA